MLSKYTISFLFVAIFSSNAFAESGDLSNREEQILEMLDSLVPSAQTSGFDVAKRYSMTTSDNAAYTGTFLIYMDRAIFHHEDGLYYTEKALLSDGAEYSMHLVSESSGIHESVDLPELWRYFVYRDNKSKISSANLTEENNDNVFSISTAQPAETMNIVFDDDQLSLIRLSLSLESGDTQVNFESFQNGTAQDSIKEVISSFESMCSEAHPGACEIAGFFNYDYGEQEERVAGLRLLNTACIGGRPLSCSKNGNVFYAAQSYEEARMFFDRACGLGEGDSCFAYSHMLSEGKGGPVDLPSAKMLQDRACALGTPTYGEICD